MEPGTGDIRLLIYVTAKLLYYATNYYIKYDQDKIYDIQPTTTLIVNYANAIFKAIEDLT